MSIAPGLSLDGREASACLEEQMVGSERCPGQVRGWDWHLRRPPPSVTDALLGNPLAARLQGCLTGYEYLDRRYGLGSIVIKRGHVACLMWHAAAGAEVVLANFKRLRWLRPIRV